MHSVAARYQSISTSVRPPSRWAPVSANVTFQSWRKMKRITPTNTVRAAASPAYARWERAAVIPIHAYLAAALTPASPRPRPWRLRSRRGRLVLDFGGALTVDVRNHLLERRILDGDVGDGARPEHRRHHALDGRHA